MGLSQRREKLVVRLGVPRTRAKEGAVLVEGVRAVSEALDAGVDVRFALVSPRLGESEAGVALAGRLSSHDVTEVAADELDRLSDTERGQGVLLVCAEPAWGLEAIGRGGRWVLLDGVQDPGNAGTIIRAAVAFGMDGVACLDGSVDPWGAKPVRASAGMVFRLPVVRASAGETLDRLDAEGVPLFVADAAGEDVGDHLGMESFAIALGNEGRGVRDSVRGRAAGSLSVRMPGGTESLNVAMAGAVLLYALTGRPRRG